MASTPLGNGDAVQLDLRAEHCRRLARRRHREHGLSANSANNVIDDAGSAGGLTNSASTATRSASQPCWPRPGRQRRADPTIALLTGSPAINTGAAVISGYTVPTTDQRGALRNPTKVNNGATIDVGAFEISSSYLVTSTGDSLARRDAPVGGLVGQQQPG